MAAHEISKTEEEEEVPLNVGFEDNEDFFVFLFGQHILRLLLQSTSELVKFADSKSVDGTMKRDRLIFPQSPFIKALLALSAGSGDNLDAEASNDGDSTSEPKGPIDPEHLPPVNA